MSMKPVVLLIDDDNNILQGMVRLLRQQPYMIMTARSAEEAMEILKAHRVDLVVTDENMCGITGSEFVVWIAKHFPDVTRIILTGSPNVQSMMNAINKGKIFQYLTKPCQEFQLAMAIRDGLEFREKRLIEQKGSEQTI
jgi:DNA-binding NtrC family response regulator